MSKDETPISDQLKKVVDDLDLESKVKEATAAAEQAVLRGLEATGSYLRDHRADIEGFFERAGAAIDRQTSGRYADQVEQVRGQLAAGVASLADRQWAPLDRQPDELEAPEVAVALDSPDVTAPEERPGSVDDAERLGRLDRPGLSETGPLPDVRRPGPHGSGPSPAGTSASYSRSPVEQTLDHGRGVVHHP